MNSIRASAESLQEELYGAATPPAKPMSGAEGRNITPRERNGQARPRRPKQDRPATATPTNRTPLQQALDAEILSRRPKSNPVARIGIDATTVEGFVAAMRQVAAIVASLSECPPECELRGQLTLSPHSFELELQLDDVPMRAVGYVESASNTVFHQWETNCTAE